MTAEGGSGLIGGLPASPRCPFCNRVNTELFNAFGSQLSVATYWCRDCRTAFEFLKWGSPAQSTSSTSSK